MEQLEQIDTQEKAWGGGDFKKENDSERRSLSSALSNILRKAKITSGLWKNMMPCVFVIYIPLEIFRKLLLSIF